MITIIRMTSMFRHPKLAKATSDSNAWVSSGPRRRTLRGSMRLLAAALGATVLAGCTPWATYPQVPGRLQLADPMLAPIPDVMAQAIWEVNAMDGGGEPIVFNLPEGTPNEVYGRVIQKLGGGWPMREDSETAIHVTEVRVRGVQSEVDVVHVVNGTPRQTTVAITQNLITGFRVTDHKTWQYAVTTPAPSYFGSTIYNGTETPARHGLRGGDRDYHYDSTIHAPVSNRSSQYDKILDGAPRADAEDDGFRP